VAVIGARSSVELLAAQAQQFRPPVVALSDDRRAAELAGLLPEGTELVAGAVSIPLQDIIDFESLYDAGLNTALHVLIQAVEESDRPVIIGHNPTLDALVEYLADAPPPRSASGKLMTTAAVAVFTTGNGIDEGGCHLQQLVRPGEV